MTQKTNNGTAWMWLIVLGLAIITALFKTNNTGSSTNSPTTINYAPAGVDRNSFEHRYAKERVKLEGYSDRESAQAADAILKFHNAQQNR